MGKIPEKTLFRKTLYWIWLAIAAAIVIFVVRNSSTKSLLYTTRYLLKFTAVVAVACFIGSVFEYRSWLRFASFLVDPMIRYGRLPRECGMAFLTAIISNNAANTMVVNSFKEGKISRMHLRISGLCNSYPAMVSHSLRVMFPVVSAIGIAGILYYSITFGTGLLMTLGFLSYSRYRSIAPAENISVPDGKNSEKPSWNIVFRKSFKRTYTVLFRVVTVTAPLYLLAMYASGHGAFKVFNDFMPSSLKNSLSPEVIAVFGARFGGLVSAAGVASEFIRQHSIFTWQIVLALLIGNIFTNPFRTLKRNLPTAMGIFPGYDGFFIVMLLQVLRLLLAMASVIIIIMVFAL